MKLKKQEVHRDLLEIGKLQALERPRFADELEFPDDITQLTAKNISELMGKYAKLLAYVEQETTTWAIQVLKAEQRREQLTATLVAGNAKLLFLERWKLDQKLKSEPELQQLNQTLVRLKSFQERGLSLARTYERLITVLSRELSRKLQSNDGSRFSV